METNYIVEDDEMCQRIIQVSFTKIVNSKNERGGARLHKNLLILHLLQKAKFEQRRSLSPSDEMILSPVAAPTPIPESQTREEEGFSEQVTVVSQENQKLFVSRESENSHVLTNDTGVDLMRVETEAERREYRLTAASLSHAFIKPTEEAGSEIDDGFSEQRPGAIFGPADFLLGPRVIVQRNDELFGFPTLDSAPTSELYCPNNWNDELADKFGDEGAEFDENDDDEASEDFSRRKNRTSRSSSGYDSNSNPSSDEDEEEEVEEEWPSLDARKRKRCLSRSPPSVGAEGVLARKKTCVSSVSAGAEPPEDPVHLSGLISVFNSGLAGVIDSPVRPLAVSSESSRCVVLRSPSPCSSSLLPLRCES